MEERIPKIKGWENKEIRETTGWEFREIKGDRRLGNKGWLGKGRDVRKGGG